MPTPTSQVVCEVLAPDAVLADDLGRIAHTCAAETGQPVQVLALSQAGSEPAITLRLPVELAVAQHPVWCLACRLACFCPQARVSVLIHGEAEFAPPTLLMCRAQSA